MNVADKIKAWKNPAAHAMDNPAGMIELTGTDLELVAGGGGKGHSKHDGKHGGKHGSKSSKSSKGSGRSSKGSRSSRGSGSGSGGRCH